MPALHALLAFALLSATAAFAQPAEPAAVLPVALSGYDPVTYFSERRPSKGGAKISYDFQDRRYLFSSKENRDLFAAAPARYAPQLGGFSAPELTGGTRAQTDPNLYLVRNGRLYLFSSVKMREAVLKDPDLLHRAHEAWEKK